MLGNTAIPASVNLATNSALKSSLIPGVNTITIGDDLGTGDVEFIVMKWKDWESGETHDISYIWFESAESLKKLKRKHMVHDRDGIETGNILTMVAYNIYEASFSEQDGLWNLSVEARSGDKSVIRTYEISRRVECE